MIENIPLKGKSIRRYKNRFVYHVNRKKPMWPEKARQ